MNEKFSTVEKIEHVLSNGSVSNERITINYIEDGDGRREVLRRRDKLSPIEFIIEYIDDTFWERLTLNGKDVDSETFIKAAKKVKDFYTVAPHRQILMNTHDA